MKLSRDVVIMRVKPDTSHVIKNVLQESATDMDKLGFVGKGPAVLLHPDNLFLSAWSAAERSSGLTSNRRVPGSNPGAGGIRMMA